MRPKPTIQDIQDWKQKLETDIYAAMFAKMREVRDYYQLNFSVDNIPSGFAQHIPPTAYTKIETGVNQIITDVPEVQVIESATTQKASANRDATQEFCNYCLQQWELMNDTPPAREAAKNLMVYGLGYVKGPLYLPRMWGAPPQSKEGENESDYNKRVSLYEMRKRANFPIILRAIDPLTALPDPSGRLGFVIEFYKRLAGDVKSMWPEWDMGKWQPFDEVDWLEYWDEDWRYFEADGKPILKGGVMRNLYGFVPYGMAYSGFGKSSPEGKPEDKAIGLLHPVLSSLRAEARQMSAWDAHLLLNIFGRYLTTEDPTKVIPDMSPGAINQVPSLNPANPSIALMPQAAINRDLYAYLPMVQRNIDLATVGLSLGGERPQGVGSGYHEGLLIGQGRLKFRSPRRALENIFSRALTNACYLLSRVVQEPMPLVGKKIIKPEQIEEPVVITLNFEPQDPEENDRRLQHGLAMWTQGAISWETAAKDYWRIDQPTEEFKKIMVERVLRRPEIEATLGMAAVEDWGMREMLNLIQQQEKQLGQPTGEGLGTYRVPPPRTRQRFQAPGAEGAMETPPERGEIGG